MHDETVLSVVTPCYNEAENISLFFAQLRGVLDSLAIKYEVIAVDDGSTDSSWVELTGIPWPQLRGLRLVTNAGHQAAIDAGLRASRGSFVVTLDADGQHPAPLIPALLETATSQNCDVVYAVRTERLEESWFKRKTALWYYRSIRLLTGVPIQNNAADFRLMTRFTVSVLNDIPGNKVFRLLVPSLGFSFATVEYQANQRLNGESKYSLRKMLTLASRSALLFSTKPLRIVMGVGLVMAVLAGFWLLWVIIDFARGGTVAGWASQMSLTLVIGGVILFALGILGEYVGMIFDRQANRPEFLIREQFPTSKPGQNSEGEGCK